MKQQKSKTKKIQREITRLAEECQKEVMVDLVDIQGASLGQTFMLKFDTSTDQMNVRGQPGGELKRSRLC